MKNVKDYIIESIFDIDDKSITNKQSKVDVNLRWHSDYKDTFEMFDTLNEKQLNEILSRIAIVLTDFDNIYFDVDDTYRATNMYYNSTGGRFETLRINVINKHKNTIITIYYESDTDEDKWEFAVKDKSVNAQYKQELDEIFKQLNEEFK